MIDESRNGQITRKDLEELTGIPIGTLKRWAHEGFGPRLSVCEPVRYATGRGRRVLYDWEEFQSFFLEEENYQAIHRRPEAMRFRDYLHFMKVSRLEQEAANLGKILRGLERANNDRFNRYRGCS